MQLLIDDSMPKKFRKPTVDQLQLQCAKIGLPESEAERFFNYYESKGWKVGRTPMVSWPHALANWKKNWSERQVLSGQVKQTLGERYFNQNLRRM